MAKKDPAPLDPAASAVLDGVIVAVTQDEYKRWLIVRSGVRYEHSGEDADGRWIYSAKRG